MLFKKNLSDSKNIDSCSMHLDKSVQKRTTVSPKPEKIFGYCRADCQEKQNSLQQTF